MSDMHPAIANFFDQLSTQMREGLAGVRPDGTTISWTAASPKSRADLVWQSCEVSVTSAALVFVGASEESWHSLGRAYEAASEEAFASDFGGIARSIQLAAQERFGAEITCEPGEGPSGEPTGERAAADFEISFRDGALTVTVILSPELVEALGGPAVAAAITEPGIPFYEEAGNPVARLLHIEVPVSISLGRAQMRMKDVLALNSGSIVELEQELGDRVEVRVNNCVIARGEMVAVDGNYGVRILEMVSSPLAGSKRG
jgi:flagellar motor switch protein FliN